MQFDLRKTPTNQIYNLLIGLVAPRPIALVTSHDLDGRLNAAPFSAFNYMCIDPPIVALGAQNRSGKAIIPKDTARNIRNTREFVVNVVTEDLGEAMNICAIDFPPEVNELEQAGLTTTPSSVIAVPRIAQAHAALECREHTTLEIGRSRIILGEVVAIYVDDAYVDPKGPYIKADELHALGRMNGLGGYVRTRDAFVQIPRIKLDDWKTRQTK